MLFQAAAALLAVSGLAAASPCKPSSTQASWSTAYTSTATQAVAAAAATAKTSSPTSHVKGKAFDRIVFIWMENQDYDKAYNDPNFNYFAKKGITLSNYFATTHPSQPNYVASVIGDNLGMENDDLSFITSNVSSVIDLLEDKGVSWGYYQEDMPYTGFEGYSYVNQKTGANDYMRKHNPGVQPDSNTQYQQRLSQIKNLSMIDTSRSMFHKDLAENKLPQWMFITPNMTSDGHDSSVTVAGQWCRTFLDPLLNNTNFMQNTLVVITWDENETYTIQNNILAILLGDAVPSHLVGTEDKSFYNHYSEIATVEANWGLHTLGRWDVGANVYEWVAQKTGDKIRSWSSQELFETYFWNESYAGVFNEDGGNHEYPAPNVNLKSPSGRTVLPAIKKTWKNSKVPSYYENTIELPDGIHPPAGYAPVL